MALLMLLLTVWFALGVVVLLLLNLAKWAFRSFAPAPAPTAIRPAEHAWRAPEAVKRAS
jgi:hypothetical protein